MDVPGLRGKAEGGREEDDDSVRRVWMVKATEGVWQFGILATIWAALHHVCRTLTTTYRPYIGLHVYTCVYGRRVYSVADRRCAHQAISATVKLADTLSTLPVLTLQVEGKAIVIRIPLSPPPLPRLSVSLCCRLAVIDRPL